MIVAVSYFINLLPMKTYLSIFHMVAAMKGCMPTMFIYKYIYLYSKYSNDKNIVCYHTVIIIIIDVQ